MAIAVNDMSNGRRVPLFIHCPSHFTRNRLPVAGANAAPQTPNKRIRKNRKHIHSRAQPPQVLDRMPFLFVKLRDVLMLIVCFRSDARV